jgi:hypothetical protein
MMNVNSSGEEAAGKNREEVLLALAGLHFQAMRTLSRNDVGLAGLQKLAETAVQIRSVLAEWKKVELMVGKEPHLIGLIEGVTGSYLDLEGRLKEARNSLVREAQKSV